MLLQVRQRAAIHAKSPIEIVEARRGLYAAFVARKLQYLIQKRAQLAPPG